MTLASHEEFAPRGRQVETYHKAFARTPEDLVFRVLRIKIVVTHAWQIATAILSRSPYFNVRPLLEAVPPT